MTTIDRSRITRRTIVPKSAVFDETETSHSSRPAIIVGNWWDGQTGADRLYQKIENGLEEY